MICRPSPSEPSELPSDSSLMPHHNLESWTTPWVRAAASCCRCGAFQEPGPARGVQVWADANCPLQDRDSRSHGTTKVWAVVAALGGRPEERLGDSWRQTGGRRARRDRLEYGPTRTPPAGAPRCRGPTLPSDGDSCAGCRFGGQNQLHSFSASLDPRAKARSLSIRVIGVPILPQPLHSRSQSQLQTLFVIASCPKLKTKLLPSVRLSLGLHKFIAIGSNR